MSEKLPYTQLNLPKYHLSNESLHYTPYANKNEIESARRDNLRPGSLILEQQYFGVGIASSMISELEKKDIDDGGFTTRMLAIAGINSSWFSFARNSNVMSRRLTLPKMVEVIDGVDYIESREGLMQRCKEGMFNSAIMAGYLYDMHEHGIKVGERAREVSLGRNLGNTSLSLACLDVVDTTKHRSAFDAQDLAREHSLQLIESSKSLVNQIGSYPSMAQFAESDSELMVHWRRFAPNGTVGLLNRAIEGWSDTKRSFGEG